MKTPGAISTVGVVDVDMAKYETSVEKNMVLVTRAKLQNCDKLSMEKRSSGLLTLLVCLLLDSRPALALNNGLVLYCHFCCC